MVNYHLCHTCHPISTLTSSSSSSSSSSTPTTMSSASMPKPLFTDDHMSHEVVSLINQHDTIGHHGLCTCVPVEWSINDDNIARNYTREWAIPRKWSLTDHYRYWDPSFREIVQTLLRCHYIRSQRVSSPSSASSAPSTLAPSPLPVLSSLLPNGIQRLPKSLLFSIIEMISPSTIIAAIEPCVLVNRTDINTDIDSIEHHQRRIDAARLNEIITNTK
jgi:hypothetical protein